MVQVIENATRLYGTVLSVRTADGATQITLRVERSEPVEGLASLLQAIPGSQVELLVPGLAPQALMPGQPVSLEARLKGPGVVHARLLQ